ncbi:MAG: DUF5714 domain-containing protein [Muribaculaceae bacterium]|nr:DUF5714 domain-containing protein [Muribaculaceae bacterium]
MNNDNNECLLCGAHLVYADTPVEMECALCHKKFINNVRCAQGHYVCDACHTSGVDSIVALCLHESSCNPIEIVEKMMSLPSCHMHGPEHHVMVGAALITAYHNAGGAVDLERALTEMVRRGKQVPGGACGNWGACGAAVSTGMYMSIVTGSTPLATRAWSLSNLMTARALEQVASHGGPRCCKRDSYLSIMAAVHFTTQELGITMQLPEHITCTRSRFNNQCLGSRCPFSPRLTGLYPAPQ